jgi:hypothetical protein
MIDYIKPIYGKHYSKRITFKNECGGCGKPLRKNSRNKIGYLCSECVPPRERTGDNGFSACHNCPFELDCTARVQLGLWVRCETPDIADLERLKFAGELDDERIRTELENMLGKRGQRKILEEAISQSAQKIYQSYSSGKQGKIPIGIRERV